MRRTRYDIGPRDRHAKLFRPMSNSEFARLKRSMQRYGFLRTRPILLWDKRLVDGHNRYMVARALGMPYYTQSLLCSERDAIQHVFDLNTATRSLTQAEIASADAILVECVEAASGDTPPVEELKRKAKTTTKHAAMFRETVSKHPGVLRDMKEGMSLENAMRKRGIKPPPRFRSAMTIKVRFPMKDVRKLDLLALAAAQRNKSPAQLIKRITYAWLEQRSRTILDPEIKYVEDMLEQQAKERGQAAAA